MNAIDPSLARCYDNLSLKTSAFDFILDLQAFLGRNRIDFIGPFRMQVQPTSNNNWTLLVEGESSISDWHVDQGGLDLVWPGLPSPPDDLLAHEMESAGARMTMEYNYSANPIPPGPEETHPSAPPLTDRTPINASESSAAAAGRRRHKRKLNLTSSDNEGELIVKYLSQNMLCEDVYGLLESELPRWTSQGIWPKTLQTLGPDPDPSSTSPPSPYFKLERAYRAVCQITSRMSDDIVRDRVGLIQLHREYSETHQGRRYTPASNNRIASTVGRGDASRVIDCILENIHEGWTTLGQRRRTELRAKFHERKKYGKRWFQLASALGPGILLICSTKLANAVRGTTVTAKMLDAVIERLKLLFPDSVKAIGIVSPLASSLMENKGFRDFQAASILNQLRSVLSPDTRK
ncbi:hypothetical protein BDW59DRAFT_152448 [Aspergillus cavernicola]|uniref:Uncharacterized protein n=1 Tax=Aspergillus cavernicola TaxID=176166 RepID=A0ABR4HRJ3_9EURO